MGTPPSGEPVQTAPGDKKPMALGEGALVALFAGAAVLTIAVVALNLIGNEETADLASPSPTISGEPSETPIPRTQPPPQPNDPDASPAGTLPSLPSVGPDATPPPGTDPWLMEADHLRNHIGEEFAYHCPPGGEPGVIWGTDIYTDDSLVCTAAVHAGIIGLANGGDVTIRMMSGLDAYQASLRFGIQSTGYGPWYASYEFVP